MTDSPIVISSVDALTGMFSLVEIMMCRLTAVEVEVEVGEIHRTEVEDMTATDTRRLRQPILQETMTG